MNGQSRRLYEFGAFQLDREGQILSRAGVLVPVTPKVFELLVVLVENVGRVVPKDDLIRLVWKECCVEEGNLAVSVFKLRQVLDQGQSDHSYIETVPRRGYRFVANVRQEHQNENERSSPAAENSSIDKDDLKRTIAVLPFKFIGPVGDEFMGLGIADALITRLSTLTNIAVRPTSSVSRFNGTQDPVAAGKELNVESVLEGSIQKHGKRVRVTTQLVNAGDGSILWAAKFDEKFSNIFAMEDSISEQVANALKPELTRKERKLLAKRNTESAEAHEAYLRGRYFFAKRTKDGLRKGIECFNRAIEIDKNYALAYSGLSDCYGLLRGHNVLPLSQCDHRVEQAALSALEIDGELAEAHASLGQLRTRQWDWSSAEREFKLAILLKPDCAPAHNWYAVFLQLMGLSDEALLENSKALELDPLSVVFRSTRGKLYYFSGRYDLAIEQLSKTLELEPQYAIACYCIGLVYEAKGLHEKAITAFEQANTLLGAIPEMRACFGRIHALLGRRSEALAAIDELVRLPKECHVEPYFVALIYAALGDKDDAFRWLERGCAEHDEDLAMLKVDPRIDCLRSDARFVDLLRRIGLPNATNRRTLDAASGGRP